MEEKGLYIASKPARQAGRLAGMEGTGVQVRDMRAPEAVKHQSNLMKLSKTKIIFHAAVFPPVSVRLLSVRRAASFAGIGTGSVR